MSWWNHIFLSLKKLILKKLYYMLFFSCIRHFMETSFCKNSLYWKWIFQLPRLSVHPDPSVCLKASSICTLYLFRVNYMHSGSSSDPSGPLSKQTKASYITLSDEEKPSYVCLNLYQYFSTSPESVPSSHVS